MENEYYDYDRFEWFLYYAFKLGDDSVNVDMIGKKGKGDGGVDLILTIPYETGGQRRIGIQAKYWKYKVGSGPIDLMGSAKRLHNLTDLWIITTSDLTSAAKERAESMEIKTLRGEDVVKLIESVKNKYDEDMRNHGESRIKFIKCRKEKKVFKKPIKAIKKPKHLLETEKALKSFRNYLSEKHNLYPVYNVFNNETLSIILTEKPTTVEELVNIKGFGPKKVEMFGLEIINFVKKNLIQNQDEINEVDYKLFQILIDEREKIAKFNKMSETDVYSDKVAKYLAKLKPKNKRALEKVYDFRKENIEIFGDYLIKIILKNK